MSAVKTWDDLGAVLGYNSREFRRWRKEPGAPTDTDVEAWRAFLAAKGMEPGGKTEAVASDAALPGECDYDSLVKAGKLTYALAKTREQVISEKIANETKRVELAKARGALVTREEADRACDLVRDSISQRYDRAIGRALGRIVDKISDEGRQAVLRAINTELEAE